ncbi:MAG: TonB-dependent receptor domain-containing protein [Bacteroidota bacterium]
MLPTVQSVCTLLYRKIGLSMRSRLFGLLVLAPFISVAIPAYTLAQEIQITGRVVNAEEQPIPGASVVLYENETKETIIRGTTSGEDGTFSLRAEPGDSYLAITFVSMHPVEQAVSLENGETLELETVTLVQEETELDEVTVEGERSYMTMDYNSRTFHVGEDVTSMGGSALEVLDNVPSVTTDFEGNVSLRGSQGVQILINGRPSNLVRSGTDALSSVPANLIREVEVITNPSARYAAEGTGGIINIKLVEGVDLGFNGTVRANTGWPQDHGLGVNLNYQKGNINWFANIDGEYEARPRSRRIYQSFHADTTYAYLEEGDFDNQEREGSAHIGADIYLPQSQILTFSGRINQERGDSDNDVRYTDYDPAEPQVFREIDENWDLLQQVRRQDEEIEREQDYEVRAQYERQFDGQDHILQADLDYEFGWENEDALLNEEILLGSATPRDQRSFSEELYRDLRFDVDYEQPLGENARLEAGLRSTVDWIDNDYTVEEFRSGTWQPPEEPIGIADNFRYMENVNALYSTYSGNLGDMTFQAGLRAENTRIETRLDQTDQQSDQNYLNLFPSLFLSYSFNEENSLQGSYSRRISRPWSRMLLPFTEITDSRNRNMGNPDLRPEFGHSMELGYHRYWEGGSILNNVYYRYRTDVIERVSRTDRLGVTTRQPINLATENAWGVEFTLDQRLFDKMNFSGSFNLFQYDREGEFEGEDYTSSSSSFYTRGRLRWQFLPGWNAQSFAYFRGSRQTTQGRDGSSFFMGAGISKRLMDRRLTISMNVWDLFNSRTSEDEVIEPDSYTLRDNSWSNRTVRFNIRYNLGR